LGVWDKNRPGSELKAEILCAAVQPVGGNSPRQVSAWCNSHVAFCSILSGIETLDESGQPFKNGDQTIVSAFEGKIYNVADLGSRAGSPRRFDHTRSGEALPYLYERHGERFLDRVNGKFAFALWDEPNKRLVLGGDRFGIEPLFYYEEGSRVVFSTSLGGLLKTGWVNKNLNNDAVLQYLLYCYNPGPQTFLRGVSRLPAAHLLSINDSGTSMKPYWRLSFAATEVRTESEYRDELLSLIKDSIRIRLDPDQAPGILLSGGTDSSTILSLTSGISKAPLNTFSFRCEGRSYDESRYARLMAERHETRHTEIAYDADHLRLMSRAVRYMDEPFCDIGIEMATYLLGKTAQGKVSYVFSGEGGDELFGGHPVYVADKAGSVVDCLPKVLTRTLGHFLQKIPDSDQKKNLQVKLKRFAYSLSFPAQLLSHRWRAYYTATELQELCTVDFLASCDLQQVYEPMLQYNRQTDGQDCLSRSLHSDYYTLVNFYLRRLQLLRGFSIESRLPLLDYRLVEYASRIPSRMKIRGISDTKYIYKKILEGILPREILYDRPKLGHSVPMKNWLRTDAKLKNWVEEILLESSLIKRGLFRSSMVRKLIDEHRSMRHNHSHRIWGLLVLELWMQAWLDTEVFSSRSSEVPSFGHQPLSVA
jgi:asparagine synthase (glutamine-hydrolysing)